MRSKLVFGHICSIFLADQAVGYFWLSFVVDRCGRRTCSRNLPQPLSSLDLVEDGRNFDCLPQLRDLMQYNITCRASFFVTAIAPSNWGLVSRLHVQRNLFPVISMYK